jgi:hypothetical protein
VDNILGSATVAATSATNAATSEANAATSETNAANSATAAASSATSAAASLDSFDDRYLGAKATPPTVDNDGDALIIGALYFDTTTDTMKVYGSSGWVNAGSSVNGTSDRQTYTATAGQTVFAATYDAGYVDVYLNGVKLLAGTDFTATNGTSITLASGAAVNDIVDIVAYGTFVLADHLTETQSDAKYVEVAGDTMTGNLDITGTLTSDGLTVDTNTLHVDAANNRVGIGTSSPSAPLQVTQTPSDTVGDVGISLKDANNAIEFGLRLDSTSKDLHLDGYYSGAWYNRMTIDRSSGNVGIGTTTPAAPIDALVNSAAYVGRFVQSNTANGDGVLVQIGSTASSDYALTVRSDGGNTPVLSAKADGNVGIGTFSPKRHLHINDPSAVATKIQITNSATGSGSDGDGFQIGIGSVGQAAIEQRENQPLSFSTNNTERMRISSSGALLVGKTADNLTDAGQVFTTAGSSFTRSGGAACQFNRNTSDGEIVRLSKDGTTVGSIGVAPSDRLYIGNSDAGLRFLGDSNLITPWNPSTNSNSDNLLDLGNSANRWKDVYVGGGVYLGGTGSANKLDDYEEGTFTGTLEGYLTAGTFSGTISGRYTKIGRLVNIDVTGSACTLTGASGNLRMSGLPYSSASGGRGSFASGYWEGFTPSYTKAVVTNSNTIGMYVIGSDIYFRAGDSAGWDNYVLSTSTFTGGGGSTYFQIAGSYYTT